MSTLTWQITLGTLFSLVEKIPKWVISKDRHGAKDYFTASYTVTEGDIIRSSVSIKMKTNLMNKFRQCRVRSHPSKQLMRLEVQCNFRQTLINRHPTMEG